MRRLVELALWLVVSAGGAAGLFWLFLGTPESSVPMLLTSAALLVAMLVLVAITGTAIILRAIGHPRRESLLRAWPRAPWFVVIALVAVAASWALMAADARIDESSGEISAWLLSTFNWTDPTPMFRTWSVFSLWVRWVVIPVLGLAALTRAIEHGWRALASWGWVCAAAHWRTLLVATLSSLVLLGLPWRSTVLWQPPTMLPLWLEVPAAAGRLGAIALVMALGASLIIVVTAKATVESERP